MGQQPMMGGHSSHCKKEMVVLTLLRLSQLQLNDIMHSKKEMVVSILSRVISVASTQV